MPVIDTTSAVLFVSRWLHFVAMFSVLGCSISCVYMGPILSALPSTSLRARKLVRGASLLAFVSGLGWLFATCATMSGGFADALDPEFLHVFFFETPFGPIAAARIGLLVALLLSAVLPVGAFLLPRASAGVAVLLLVSQAWLGHAAEGGETLYGAALIASYAAHVLSGATWLGGLLILFLGVHEQRHRSDDVDRRGDIYALLLRFSRVASFAVVVVAVTGVVNSAFRFGTHLDALITTTYGTVLLVKLGFLAAMLGLAAYNRFVAMPQLPRNGPAHYLPSSIGLEIVFGVLVLAGAAVLGVTPPPS